MNPHDSAFLSHLDDAGQIRMVDVGAKASTQRVAVCAARVRMSPRAFALLAGHERGKGEVLNTARVAGVLAAKRCAELIPLCHTLPLSFVGIDFTLDEVAGEVGIAATCRSDYKTGVEMEAMTACSVAALTLYDMCKAADKGIVIGDVRLLYKAGGKSGEWRAPGYEGPADASPARADATPAPAAHRVAGDASAATATIRVVYFARIAEVVGRREESLAVPAGLTGGELLLQLVARYPGIGSSGRLELAVNQEHAGHDRALVAGDEVAVFEPVTGG